MKTRSLALLALAAFSILTASRGAPAAEPAAKAKFVLEKGVESENILKYYGKPAEIKPMESPDKDLKVERWIYRRKVNETTTQTLVGYTTVTPPMAVSPTSGSAAIYIPSATIPTYKLKRTTVYQVTDLLMVDNKLALAKQRTEREEALE